MNKKKLNLSVFLFIFGIGISGVITYLFLNNILKVPCLFHYFTGYYCPGCGITRMLISIMKLDFMQAFHYNCLLFILLPFAIIYFSLSWWQWIHDKKMYQFSNFIWNILLIIVVLFGILRNIDLFDFLAPTLLS